MMTGPSQRSGFENGGATAAARELEPRLRRFEGEALVCLDSLLRTANCIARSRQDAEDIVQETYLRAWRYFDSFQAGTGCRAWLFRIMFNVINARRNKQAKILESPMVDEEGRDYQSDNHLAFDPVERIEERELLDAMKLLSTDHRSVLWLVVVEELSYREATEILGVPIGTVMSRLHRARRELRKLLNAA